MMTSPHSPPALKVYRDHAGNVTSVYVEIRPGPVSRTIQPNKAALVFFDLGADQLPVGINFFEPAAGVAVSLLQDYIYPDEDGKPGGVGRSSKHFFLTKAELGELALHLDHAAAQLHVTT